MRAYLSFLVAILFQFSAIAHGEKTPHMQGGIIQKCAVIFERLGLRSPKGLPLDFSENTVLSDSANHWFLSKFNTWSYKHGLWMGEADLTSNVRLSQNKNCMVRVHVVTITNKLQFWIETDSHFEALRERMRQIIYARAMFSRMYPNKNIPSFNARTTGINGVTLFNLPITNDSFQLLTFVVRQAAFYPPYVTTTFFRNMTKAEKEEAKKWFVSFYDQADNASQRVILFEDLVR